MATAADATLDRAGVQTNARWLGTPERPLLGWVTSPANGQSAGGALILPPLGYEYQTTHRTLRTLAEAIARAGWTAMRIDYDGTGDSGGDQWDADRVAAWRQSVGLGVEELRRAGHDDVCVIGLRFGGTAALLEAARTNAARVVAWAPVVSGRRYVRELRMLGLVPEPATARPEVESTLTHGGMVFDAATLHDLAAVDLSQLDARPAPSVLLIERPDGAPLATLAEHLTQLGSDVDVRTIDGTHECLDQATEHATVPDEIVRQISEWVTAAPSTRSSATTRGDVADPGRERAELRWEGAVITEAVTRLTAHDLVGLVGSPAGTARATVIWTNSGSETHVGPGRAWVEYARTLNRVGFRTIRLDCRGWGESPDDGHAPARPYDAHMAADLRDVVAEVEGRGWGPVVLAGLCAGAWMSLNVARETSLGGVIACNPQLYWKPGDPSLASMAETHAFRDAERQRLKRLGRYGLWSLLDVIGVNNPAARCLKEVDARRVPTLLLFSAEDDGLEYLHDRLARTLARSRRAGLIEVVELASIDHSMHRSWLRQEVIDAVLGFLDTLVPVEHAVGQ